MGNLVNLGCKCGARGGDPSENSHYMIIHPTTPLCIHYCQCAPLNCCTVCWKKVHSLFKAWELLRFKWNCTNLRRTVRYCCPKLLRGAWLSWAHYAGKWLSWRRRHYAAGLRNSAQRCQQAARGHLHITPIQTTIIPLAIPIGVTQKSKKYRWQYLRNTDCRIYTPIQTTMSLLQHALYWHHTQQLKPRQTFTENIAKNCQTTIFGLANSLQIFCTAFALLRNSK